MVLILIMFLNRAFLLNDATQPRPPPELCVHHHFGLPYLRAGVRTSDHLLGVPASTPHQYPPLPALHPQVENCGH